MNCEAFYKQAIKFVLSKIKKDNSHGPMWSEHMCSINYYYDYNYNYIILKITIIKEIMLGSVCVCVCVCVC